MSLHSTDAADILVALHSILKYEDCTNLSDEEIIRWVTSRWLANSTVELTTDKATREVAKMYRLTQLTTGEINVLTTDNQLP